MYYCAIINDHFLLHKNLLKKVKDMLFTLMKYNDYYFQNN